MGAALLSSGGSGGGDGDWSCVGVRGRTHSGKLKNTEEEQLENGGKDLLVKKGHHYVANEKSAHPLQKSSRTLRSRRMGKLG